MPLSLFRRPKPADPTHLRVEHGSAVFEVALRRRPTAKRVTLRVSGITGEIVLTLPPRSHLKAAQAFADAHAGWLAQRVARVPDRVAFVPGARVPLRGEPHLIVHAGSGRGVTRARPDPEPMIAVWGDAAAIPGRVTRFLAAEASRDLRQAVSRYAGGLGVTTTRITLRDTRSRWGSCSSSGALSFSWRLAMAPSFVLDYLAAHEVAHLREMNHSPRYWAIVHDLCAHTDEAEVWLKRHGQGLHRYG